MSIDKITRGWMRNASDDKAVANGCWFEPVRASYAVWWIERYCRLYEGSDGGPLILRGCGQCKADIVTPDAWYGDDGEPLADVVSLFMDRSASHCECYRKGHRMDWQYETFMRGFGWVRRSEQWNRDVRRFREWSIWIAKKNKKSPTLAALGMYLLAGDGEPGQKVFLGAKDGLQAREIAGQHAIEMLYKSPELEESCTVNKVKSQITHESSRSILKPLSSSNVRTKESKEGLNGSVLVDETHVVDRDFIDRISRAGISRAEPLQAEFSTAGNNPDSYGHERFEYAEKVISGEVEDQGLLAVVHAAPQDLSAEELAKDPLNYGRMANPAMGHTVDPDEYLNDYQKSKVSPEKLAQFMMYRLNVWQRTASPWLNRASWLSCSDASITPAALAGRECFGAMDIARVYDMTALVLMFPPIEEEEPWKLLPWFWLPEDTVTQRESLAAYRSWVAQGALRLTPGSWGEDEPIREQLNEAKEMFKVRAVGYDKRFADSLVMRMKSEDGWGEEQLVEVPQYINHYTSPTEEFERLVLAEQIAHPGNPVLDWQAGHVVLDRNRDKGKKPVKPKKADFRSVDGIQAAVMALGLAMASPKEAVPELFFV